MLIFLWIKDAPKLSVKTEDEVCTFIDQYIKCNIQMMNTSFQSLKTLIATQPLAGDVGKCFHYPRPPSPETVVAQHFAAATYAEETAQEVKALTTVRKVLDNKNTPEYINMDELLLKTNLPHNMYVPIAIWTQNVLHRK